MIRARALRVSFLVSLSWALVAGPGDAFGAQEVLEVEGGPIEGELLDPRSGLRVFRAVPYARAGRWQAPRPVEPWEDVRPAHAAGPPCPQSPLIAMLSGEALPPTSEECLHLDVWTAAETDDAGLPVLVWIHGGGLVGGWSSQALFDGASFAREGLVFVSIQYRLGPLGYFAHPALAAESEHGASGNYGLLDQIAALRWVQRNVAAFGGDPARVTIMGESAGATSVLSLCTSPLAKGLFQGAIAQSTWITPDNFAPLEEAQARGLTYAELLLDGAEVDPASAAGLAALRALPADALWRDLAYRFQPALVVDGWSLTEFPERAFEQGAQHDVPLIAGTTADEGTVFLSSLPYSTAEAFRKGMGEVYGAGAERVLALYPVDDAAALRGQIASLIGDEWFVRGTRKMLAGMQQVSSPAWQYVFTRANPQMPTLGAHHAVDVAYSFGRLPAGASAQDRELSRQLHAAWVRFARTGEPDGVELGKDPSGEPLRWPAWRPEEQAYLEFGVPLRTGLDWRRSTSDALEELRD